VDGEFWLVKALSTVHKLENESKHASLLLEADEEETSLRAKTRESMTNLKTVRTGDPTLIPDLMKSMIGYGRSWVGCKRSRAVASGMPSAAVLCG
jgi:hypothetical protein